MSLTCIHLDADAIRHPECPGCAALMAGLAAVADEASRTNAERRAEAGPALIRPLEHLARRLADQRAEPERHEPAEREVMQARVEHELVDGGFRHEMPRPSLFAERTLTPEEQTAREHDPRPGTWYGDVQADGQVLTQDETDTLIRNELVDSAPSAERNDVMALVGRPRWLILPPEGPVNRPRARARVQRGGIDSDPLVRLLVHRAWGDRDRLWFELRGVRKGERVAVAERALPWRAIASMVALAWPGDPVIGIAQHDARPGESLHVVEDDADGRDQPRRGEMPQDITGRRFRVTDRLRKP